jgi:hypothetical protein
VLCCVLLKERSKRDFDLDTAPCVGLGREAEIALHDGYSPKAKRVIRPSRLRRFDHVSDPACYKIGQHLGA